MDTKSNDRNMNDELKRIPHFDNEYEERAFWATHDSTEYIDWDKAEINPVFPDCRNLLKRLLLETRIEQVRVPFCAISQDLEQSPRLSF